MSSLRRFGIDANPQSMEELQAAFSKLCDLVSGFIESPDMVVGSRSVRVKFPSALEPIRRRRDEKGQSPQFAPLTVRKIVSGETVTWGVRVGQGSVIEIIPRAGEGTDATMEHLPYITPAPSEEVPSPSPVALDGTHEIIIANGDTVWCRYQTSDMGDVFGEPEGEDEDRRPTIGFGASPPTSTHYQPPNPDEDEGTEGDYHVKLFKISVNEETGGHDIEYFCQSDIYHYHEVWKGENLGEGAGPFKKRDAPNDVYQWRGHKGRHGHKTEESGDDINHDFWGENQGTGVAVYIFDPEAPVVTGPAKLRTLRGLSSSEASDEGITPQLRVEVKNEPGEELPDPQAATVLFRGNGKKGSRVWLQCDETTEIARIEWADGFVTSEGDLNIIVGDCPGSSTEPPPP